MSTFPCPEYVVSADELTESIGREGVLLLDAREAGDYASGHLPGAVHLSPSSLEWSVKVPRDREVHHLLASAERIGPLLRACGLRRGGRVAIYDEGGSCLASRLFWILDFLGHPRPSILDGGVAAWRARGGRLETRALAPPPGDFEPRPEFDKIADFDHVLWRMGREDVCLCNALPEDSFRREAIPGSTSIPYRETFDPQAPHRLRPAEELAALLGQRADPAKELILYCGIGYTASQDYWVARLLGYPRVRLYDGSLADWKARHGPLTAAAAPGAAPHPAAPRPRALRRSSRCSAPWRP